MEKGKQRELLEKIEDISMRKEVAQIYQKTFEKLAEYQEAQLKNICRQVEQELLGSATDYTVASILCKKEDISRFWEGFSPLLSTGMLEPCWGSGAIERIYLRADHAFLKQVLEKDQVYPATIQTNYEAYHVSVALKQVSEGLEQVRKINKLMFLHGVDMPRINDICIQKFYDVCFWEVNDRLRQDEKIESIQVEWGELAPYVQKDVCLLWNVQQVNLKENTFPMAVALIDEIRYDHQVLLPHKNSAYLIEMPQGEICQVMQKDNIMRIRNFHKEYQNWTAYEIIPVPRQTLKNEKCDQMTNGVKQDIFKGLLNSRALSTKCELYRNVMSYEMAAMFQQIAVQDSKELLFYPKNPGNYLNLDVMEYILKDMSVLYGGYRLTGRLVENDK